MKPSEIELVGPGGERKRDSLAGTTRQIINEFEGEEFQAIHVISVLRKSENPQIKVRSDTALKSSVRQEIRKMIDRGSLEVIESPKVNGGTAVAGVYREIKKK